MCSCDDFVALLSLRYDIAAFFDFFLNFWLALTAFFRFQRLLLNYVVFIFESERNPLV